MRRILVTGMSGTGKSTALAELGRRGFRVVETDEPGWKELEDGEPVWREERMSAVLAVDTGPTLFVSGCVANQGRFYDRFDAVVLLSAPAEVILERILTRTTNDFGKRGAERERILEDLALVEPRLRASATHEIDTTGPLDAVVEHLVAIAEMPDSARSTR
jgi:dephospho-CoA kinase